MINITNTQSEALKKYNVDIDKALKNDDIELLLNIIDYAIVENIVDNNDEPNEVGIRLQRIYDEISYQNEEN